MSETEKATKSIEYFVSLIMVGIVTLTVSIVRIVGFFEPNRYDSLEFGVSDSGALAWMPSIVSLVLLLALVLLFILSQLKPLPASFYVVKIIIANKDIMPIIKKTLFIVFILLSLLLILLGVINFIDLVNLFAGRNDYESRYYFSVRILIEQIVIFFCALYISVLMIKSKLSRKGIKSFFFNKKY